MLYGKYSFTCRFENDAILPLYKGSTFRGLFGVTLKNAACVHKRQECVSCLLKSRCLYARVFETPLALAAPEGSRISSPPHPFVLEPPSTAKSEFTAGEELTCGLLLFGEINHSLPYLVYAFDQMGKIGVGRRVNGKKGRFYLRKVISDNKPLYSYGKKKLSMPESVRDLFLSGQGGHIGKIKVSLRTPLRLKFENEIKAALPFHVLVRGMLRRVSSLMNTWGGGEPDLDYKGLIERAAHIGISDNTLRWFDWKRYSNRQERKMFMGGLLGSVTYEGALEEYLPLLHFCENVHIGKNTSFGLGRIEIRTNDSIDVL